jgi:hypothetical protein
MRAERHGRLRLVCAHLVPGERVSEEGATQELLKMILPILDNWIRNRRIIVVIIIIRVIT